MAWVTPKVDYESSDGLGFADLNTINSNLDYIYNTGIKPDTNASWAMGRVRLFGLSDVAYFSHYDHNNTSAYGLKQVASGATFLNAPTGESVYVRVDDTNIAYFQGAAITLVKPVTASSTLNVDGNLNPTTTPTSGTWAVSATSVLLIDRGLYMVEENTDVGLELQIQVSSGVWVKSVGSVVVSDGINVRLQNSIGITLSLRYLKS